MELYFLGTGAGLPSKTRNVTSIALRLDQERSAFWLFDCGEGTQHQMLSSPLRPTKLEKIFITHLHGDHIYGLPGLFGSRAFQAGEKPVTLYGPAGIRRFVETAIEVSSAHLPYKLNIVEVDEGPVAENEHFRIRCRRLQHGVLSLGYRIEEKDGQGKLRRDQLESEGIPEGPIYKRLKAGETVALPDGRTIEGSNYVDPPTPGRTIVILGDTRPTDAAVDLARGATILVHEGTYMAADAVRAEKHNHSTTVDAATVAKRADVSQLVLTHVSARYDELQMKAYLAESRRIFPNTTVAKDHLNLVIPKPERESRFHTLNE